MIEPLYQDEGFEPFTGPSAEDEITARTLLIEYHRNARKAAELRELAERVEAEYLTRVDRIERRNEQVREMLRLYCLDHGPVSFPDAGSAHTVNRQPAPRIEDPAAVLAWAHVHAPTLIQTKETVPAKALAEHVKAMGGELPPGVDVHHPEPTITIKGAS